MITISSLCHPHRTRNSMVFCDLTVPQSDYSFLSSKDGFICESEFRVNFPWLTRHCHIYIVPHKLDVFDGELNSICKIHVKRSLRNQCQRPHTTSNRNKWTNDGHVFVVWVIDSVACCHRYCKQFQNYLHLTLPRTYLVEVVAMFRKVAVVTTSEWIWKCERKFLLFTFFVWRIWNKRLVRGLLVPFK